MKILNSKFQILTKFKNSKSKLEFRVSSLGFPCKGRAGFTLIELITVISIIGVLAGIGVQSYFGAQQKARDAQRKSDFKAIQSALELYYNDNNRYPTTGGWQCSDAYTNWISDSTTGAFGSPYMSSVPVDPRNKQTCTGTCPLSKYVYCYTGTASGYGLTTVLENPNDPQASDGSLVLPVGGPIPKGEYAVRNP